MMQFGVPTLVIREFEVNGPGTDGAAIKIVGRAAGFTQWLLTLMGISTLTTFKLHGEELSVVSAGLRGESHTVIPISAVETTRCGYSKPIGWLILGAALLVFGLSTGETGGVTVGILGALIGAAVYYLQRSMFISVAAGNHVELIKYKKGVVDGEPVDLERTLQAIGVVNKAVLNRRSA